jgi:hypothetical protein
VYDFLPDMLQTELYTCLLPACLTTGLEILNNTFSATENSILGWLPRVNIGNLDRISEVRAASVFMTDVCNVRVFFI